MKSLVLASCFGLSLFSLQAQETQRFTFSAGGGFTTPVGSTGRRLDDGWNVQGSAGYNFSPYVGAVVQLDFNSMGINGATLSNIGVPGGDVHIFSATLDPVVHLAPKSRFDPYFIGGGGIYHRNQEFTAPGTATVAGFDSFFGFYPQTIQTTQVLGSYSVNKFGVNGGMGIALGSKWHGKFFAEARYNRIYMGNNHHTDYVPVSFGFRW